MALKQTVSDAGLVWLGDAKDLPEREMVERCKRWIKSKTSMRRTINRKHTSYGLKHLAEKEIGYVTNGAFIQAALELGLDAVPTYWGSPNAYFNISISLYGKGYFLSDA